MAQTLDGFTLPHYSEFKPLNNPDAAKNYSLKGRLWIDYISIRSGWQITIPVLEYADFFTLRQKYEKQFREKTFLPFVDDDLSIDTDVFLEMPAESDLKWNKSACLDFTFVLEPKDADNL